MLHSAVYLLVFVWLGLLLSGRARAAIADTLRWRSAPSNAQAGVSFGASLQALDAAGNATTNFNGTVRLSALARSASPRLLISEVAALSTRAVELCNVSETQVSVSGWRLTFYDSTSWPAPRATFTVPPGTVCAPRSVFHVASGGTAPGLYPAFSLGTNLTWSSNSPDNPIAVLLRDEKGTILDFFCACGGYPVMITSPAAIPAAQWQGLPVPVNATSSRSYQRAGTLDHDNAADWLATNSTLGILNAALRFPFSAPLRVLPVVPSTAQINLGQWEGTLTLAEPGSGVWLRADDGAGLVGDSPIFDVLAGPPLRLELPSGGSEANPGLLGAGRVFIPQTLPTNLTVMLSLNLGGEFALPSSVILGAGQTNVTFAVTNLDDALLDGTRSVTVTASASGFAPASAVMTNADNEVGQLRVTIPASAREGDGVLAAAGQVSLNVPVGVDYAVTLSSSDTNEVQVPANLFIPSGQTSALFNVTIVNDLYLDGTRSAMVTATAVGAVSASAPITVLDNENSTLLLELGYPYEEGRGIVSNAVRVTLGGLATSNVVVSLVSLNPARVQVPPTLTVPAGQNIVYTHLIFPDDALTNGFEIVQVNASAPGFPDA
jgi:hypothetical protein